MGTAGLNRRAGGASSDTAFARDAVTLTSWSAGAANSITRASCVTTVGENISSEYVFRTGAAPLRPGSLSVQFARAVGGTQSVTAGIDGKIEATGITGAVDVAAGLDYYRKSLALCHADIDAIERSKTLNNIGINLKNLGDLAGAQSALDEARGRLASYVVILIAVMAASLRRSLARPDAPR